MFQNALFLMPPKCTQKGILTRSYCTEGIFFGFFWSFYASLVYSFSQIVFFSRELEHTVLCSGRKERGVIAFLLQVSKPTLELDWKFA